MENNRIKGLVVAMITPFNEDGSISKVKCEKLVEHLIEEGVDGLFALGTNGEAFQMEHDEKAQYIRWVCEAVRGRVKVIAGAGMCSTIETIELIKEFKDAGADAVSVVNPYFVKLKKEELINHYRVIAENSDLPVYLYNMPKNTGMNIDADILEEIIKFKNIKGIKDSSGDMENTEKYIELAKGKDFSVLMGSDSKILASLKLGADGFVASTANVISGHLRRLYDAFKNGNMEEAEKLQKDVDVLRNTFKLATQPAVTKRALKLLGIDVGECRLPIMPLPKEYNKDVEEMLNFYNLKK